MKPRHATDEAVYLGDVMEAWSFAVQANNDGVMSSVVVVLALLLQILSGSLQLVSHGLGICQTLLQDRQLKSLSRNLSAEKSKAFIISPTLRMLREAVSIDGGAYAKRIFRARQHTFTSLGRNLEIGHASDTQEDPKKASVRTNAVKFLLSCIKYLHSDGRKELLSQKDLLSHLTYMIKGDPAYLVVEIIDTLKEHILMDDRISRESKFRNFNTKTLLRFLALYNYGPGAHSDEERTMVSEKTHGFLVYVCTAPGAGILYPSTGLYPKLTDDQPRTVRAKGVGQGLDRSLLENRFQNGIPVYNFVLSEFAQKLRPWSSLKHSELLVAIFTAAPELIADYFFNNRSFTFEPKLTMTWIGYASFLFTTMQIPLPPSFGDRSQYAHSPPPTSILLDNVLPLPLNQKVLTRCLTSNSNLTSFFATRILVLALEKQATAVEMLDHPSTPDNSIWSESVRSLTDAFCQRIPDMKEIVRSYKNIPSENLLHKTVASRLLRLYYETIPRVALAANFDVSPLFVDVLKNLDAESSIAETRAFGVIELENLVSIASHSPGMKWFSKVENLTKSASCSPFTALLRLLCADTQEASLNQLRKTLTTVAVEGQLVSRKLGLNPLLQSLRSISDMKDVPDPEVVWSFLDNCVNRCASSPIKYLELAGTYMEDLQESTPDPNISLLNVTFIEQLPFSMPSRDRAEKKALGKFLSLYLYAAAAGGEDKSFSQTLYDKVREILSTGSVKMKKFGEGSEAKLLKSHGTGAEEADDVGTKEDEISAAMDQSKLKDMLDVSLPDADNTGALTKWSTKNVEDLVEDGWAAGLIRLLGSTFVNIRKESVTNILKMAAKVKESAYEEKEQIWLLLCEVAESSKGVVDSRPAPSAFPAFATHALDVLRNPLHPLYPKVNTFLTRSPVWSPEKLPLAHDILHGEPSEDDRYYTEIAWLLTYLLDALVLPADLDVFRKKQWFEKILVLGSNPYLRFNLRTKILRIVYRATCIESGSTTLVTRFGVMSWLDAQRAACDVGDEKAVYAALMTRVWETCDQAKVTSWSQGGVPRLLKSHGKS